MKCPHCLIEFVDDRSKTYIGGDPDGHWYVVQRTCANEMCNRLILHLMLEGSDPTGAPTSTEWMIRPRIANREPLSPDVPSEFSEDYREACLVLPDSPKASAALSRRCLQHLLREAAKVKPSDLASEIQELIDRKELPSYIREPLDAVRVTGNFAAHPIKSKSTGEVVPVEEGEAEWNLEVLEMLFDFYFVQPAVVARKKEKLNEKLRAAGKPEMK